jgi:hypothetical protein
MLIGIPKEIKADEYRVGLIPSTVKELVARGHKVEVETRAGDGAGISDEEYSAVGARLVPTADAIFQSTDLIVKVKEPLASERSKLRRGQAIFTYLHLAPDREQTSDLLASGVIAIAYETVTDAAGNLPLLAPMSKVAGRTRDLPMWWKASCTTASPICRERCLGHRHLRSTMRLSRSFWRLRTTESGERSSMTFIFKMGLTYMTEESHATPWRTLWGCLIHLPWNYWERHENCDHQIVVQFSGNGVGIDRNFVGPCGAIRPRIDREWLTRGDRTRYIE